MPPGIHAIDAEVSTRELNAPNAANAPNATSATSAKVGAEAHYAARKAAASARAAGLSARSNAISFVRLLFALLGIALAVLAQVRGWGPKAWVGAILAAIAFIVLVVVHDRVIREKQRQLRCVAWAEQGLARLNDRYSHLPLPHEPTPPDDHPYAGDLDVFGRASLMQSLDTTRTAEGKRLLGAWLSQGAVVDEIALRQACAKELSGRIDFLEELWVEGALLSREPPDVEKLLAWIDDDRRPSAPSELKSRDSFAVPAPSPVLESTPLLQGLALGLPTLTLSLLFFGGHLPLPRPVWLVALAAQLIFLLSSMRHRRAVIAAVTAASENHEALSRYARVFAAIEGAEFVGNPLRELRAQLVGASLEVRRLSRIVGYVDARRNEVFRLLIGPLLLWDLNCALFLIRWRKRAGSQVRRNIAAMARVEALSALATRAFEHPDDAWPEVRDRGRDAVQLDAQGLGHPLIAWQKVVRNDVSFGHSGSVLLVTGSNMSGKSTLLRAIGTNVVLALAGAPVRARALRVSPFDVRTSMRVSDSLSEGISHFLAELRRLKGVIDAANGATQTLRPVLFLLDEILHGTNSRERHLGARAIVRHLSQQFACGAVSTHDLALSALADEVKGRVENVHFREDVTRLPDGSETMTFDYRLRKGVLTTRARVRLQGGWQCRCRRCA
ncbi:MAG: MutS family DNA mismatch repair protein [Polyangiales bacterium]